MAQNFARSSRLRDLILIALFAALISICSWISLPFFTLPITMQTFALFCTVGILGTRRGALAVLLYLALGLIGLPVFSGMTGGFAVLLGPGGGYLIGFILLVLISGRTMRLLPAWRFAPFLGMLLGLLTCYTAGALWYMCIWAGTGAAVGFFAALSVCVLPYLLPDLCKLVLALIVSHAVKRHISI